MKVTLRFENDEVSSHWSIVIGRRPSEISGPLRQIVSGVPKAQWNKA